MFKHSSRGAKRAVRQEKAESLVETRARDEQHRAQNRGFRYLHSSHADLKQIYLI